MSHDLPSKGSSVHLNSESPCMSKVTEFADLSRLVRPRNVVVVGGSRRAGTPGAALLDNLLQHSRLPGKVHVVNPSMQSDDTVQCWPSVADLPEVEIDVALIIVKASLVLDALRDCAARHIPFAIIMSSGFAETDDEGKALEAEIRALSAKTGIRIYGPNCPGLTNVHDRIGMTFSRRFAEDADNTGSIGLITQGGGAGRNAAQGLTKGIGTALWFSAGNQADLDTADFIAHMAHDPAIKLITMVLEGVNNGPRFIAALKMAREQKKPVVVLKVGRSEYGVRAAQSHTGSIAGVAAINSAVFRQFGAIEVEDLDELIAVSRLLADGRRPESGGIAVFTFSGGAGAMAADHIGLRGLRLAELSETTRAQLRQALPSYAAIGNPVDVTATALVNSEMLASCLKAVSDDPSVGAILLPFPADYGAGTERIARAAVDAAAITSGKIVAVWMSRYRGGGFQILEDNGLAPFESLSKAVSALEKVLPRPSADPKKERSGSDTSASHPAGSTHRPTALSEPVAKQMLRAAGVPVPSSTLASSAQEAAAAGSQIGFPVVMKIASAQITHKTEVNGVRLNVRSAEEAARTYADLIEKVGKLRPDALLDGVLVEKMLPAGGREMLIGIHRDPTFGPVVTLGLGGIFVELLKDVSHRALPIDEEDARQMIAELRYGACLAEFRGSRPADVDALKKLLVDVSQFVTTNPDIEEAEFNPVWVGEAGAGAFALDALMFTSMPPQ